MTDASDLPGPVERGGLAWTDAEYTERMVVARKDHRCDDYPRCEGGGIRAGERYLRCVAFPKHDANGSGRPWVMKLCERSSTFERRINDQARSS